MLKDLISLNTYYKSLCKAQDIINEEQFTEYLCSQNSQYSQTIITRLGGIERLSVYDSEGCVLQVIPHYNQGLFWWKQVAVRLDPEEEGDDVSGLASNLANFIEASTGHQTVSSPRFIYVLSLVKGKTLREYGSMLDKLEDVQDLIEDYIKPIVSLYVEKSKDTEALMSEHDL